MGAASTGAERQSGMQAVPPLPHEQGQPAAASVSRKASDRSMRQQRARLRKRGNAKGPNGGDAADGQTERATGVDPAAAAQPASKRARRGAGEQAEAAEKGARRPAQAGAPALKGGKLSGAAPGRPWVALRKLRTSEISTEIHVCWHVVRKLWCDTVCFDVAGQRRGGREQEDKLDALVKKYKAQLFGQPAAADGRQAAANRGGALKRWFE